MADELDKELESQKEEENKEKELEEKEGVIDTEDKEIKKEEAKTSVDSETLTKALKEQITESVRKEEKDKLYASFEKYKNDAKTAETAKEEAEKRLKEYETKNLSIDEQTTLQLKEVRESNARLKEQMEELVITANNRINTLELELTKKELLAQYEDEMIPSMVTGNTLEELAQSAENAHREYLAIRDKEIAKLKEAGIRKESIGTGVKPQNDKLNVGHTVADIKSINDPKVWEANRDKFLEEAAKLSR